MHLTVSLQVLAQKSKKGHNMFFPPSFIYGLTGLILFLVGFGGLFACSHLLRKILAINIMASGIFLVLVTIAFGSGKGIDPVPHVMVLTGIVVSVSFTGLALALACRVQETANLSQLSKKKDDRNGAARP